MLVNSGYGPVGEWYFRQNQALVAPCSLEDYRRLLALMQRFAEILARHDLLFSRLVRFHHPQWNPRDIERAFPGNMPASHLAQSCEDLLASTQHGLLSLPADTQVIGDGIIIDPSRGAQRLPDVMSLSATAYGSLAVSVATQADSWMEYTIDARAQPEVHRLNAPRLEAALVEMQQRTGIVPVVETTRFAVPTVTGLRNQFYDDGEPVDCSILLEQT